MGSRTATRTAPAGTTSRTATRTASRREASSSSAITSRGRLLLRRGPLLRRGRFLLRRRPLRRGLRRERLRQRGLPELRPGSRERRRRAVFQRLQHRRQLQPVRGHPGCRQHRQRPEPGWRHPVRLRGRRLRLRGQRRLDRGEPQQLDGSATSRSTRPLPPSAGSDGFAAHARLGSRADGGRSLGPPDLPVGGAPYAEAHTGADPP